MKNKSTWVGVQVFNVVAGRLQRSAAGQFELALDLRTAAGEEVELYGVFDATSAAWGWRPKEPTFVADFFVPSCEEL